MPTNPPLDDIPEEAAFLEADRGADRVAKKIRLAFLSALEDSVAALDKNAFRTAATYGDGGFAEATVLSMEIGRRLEDRLKDSGAKAESESSLIDEAIEIGLTLGLAILTFEFTAQQIQSMREQSAEFARAEVRQQSRWIDSETAKAIALAFLLVRRSPFVSEEVSGVLSRVFSADLYESMIGINTTQVETLINLGRSTVLAKVPVAAIRDRLSRNVEILIRQRSELIARSIAERVINLSQQAVVERAVLFGLLDPDETFRQWISRADQDVCRRCREFHLVTARIDQPFVSRIGETAWVPDIHSRGRCRVRYVRAA